MQSLGKSSESSVLDSIIKQAEQEKNIDKEVEKIRDEYLKMVDEFYNSLTSQIEMYAKLVKKHQNSTKTNAKDMFNEYLKAKTTHNLYEIYNRVFGPNEIRSKDWTNSFTVKSQSEALEKLGNLFHKLTE